MHDPYTLAFDLFPYSWRCKLPWLPHLLTIWHKDPEKDGSDDSCDWFNHGKAEDRADPRRLAVYEALWDMETLLDNRPHYPDSPEHKRFQPLKKAIRAALTPAPRWWFRHPRWHFWHWRLQFHPWQRLKRRWWDKCCVCGKRGFTGSAIGVGWDNKRIMHEACYRPNWPDVSYQQAPASGGAAREGGGS